MDDLPPPPKRARLDNADENVENSGPVLPSTSQKIPEPLNERLKDVMKCIVCHVLKPDEILQCSLGHIMCETCALHLIADAMLAQTSAQCPSCQRRISWEQITRNSPVQQAMWELSINCHLCQQQIVYKDLKGHLADDCANRIVNCKYSCIGCNWSGTQTESHAHEQSCAQPQKSASEILKDVEDAEKRQKRLNRNYRLVFKLLSSLRIHYEDLELCPLRPWTGNRIIFVSRRFHAFEESWTLLIRVINGNSHVDRTLQRCISYNLILCTEVADPLNLQYFVTKTSRVPLDIGMYVYRTVYAERYQAGGYKSLKLASNTECDRLLAYKPFFLRIWMFLK